MQNLDKPNAGVPQTELNVGSGFNLVVGSTFKLIVGSLNTLFSMTNVSKVSIGETWGTIASTWAGETQNWEEASQLITNQAMSLTEPLWSYRSFPWQLASPWLTSSTGITNQSKP